MINKMSIANGAEQIWTLQVGQDWPQQWIYTWCFRPCTVSVDRCWPELVAMLRCHFHDKLPTQKPWQSSEITAFGLGEEPLGVMAAPTKPRPGSVSKVMEGPAPGQDSEHCFGS